VAASALLIDSGRPPRENNVANATDDVAIANVLKGNFMFSLQ
jgi:hypothetical protein